MRGGGSKLTVAVAIGLLALSMAAPMAGGATTGYLTSGIALTGMTQTTLNGYEGVLANYTSQFSSPINTLVYMDLVNSARQTVYWNDGACSFAANQKVQCFVFIAGTVPKGVYGAYLFVTTTSNIPISLTKGIQVTV